MGDPKQKACPVCCNDGFETLYTGLIRCGNCGFVTADLAVNEQELQALYGPRYFDGGEYVDYLGDRRVVQRNLRRWLKTLREYVPGGNLVEIGSAYGLFLEMAKKNTLTC